MELKQIQSFQADHDKIVPGIYLSRQDGDADTYDLRMVTPNKGRYLQPGAMHTLEHLLATWLRSSAWADRVIYVGPMGCRTGFYLIVRRMEQEAVLTMVKQAFAFCAGFEGPIPGATRRECGNYRAHNLKGARAWAAEMCQTLEKWNTGRFVYPE